MVTVKDCKELGIDFVEGDVVDGSFDNSKPSPTRCDDEMLGWFIDEDHRHWDSCPVIEFTWREHELGEMPCDGSLPVVVKLRNGDTSLDEGTIRDFAGGRYDWGGLDFKEFEIVAWKPDLEVIEEMNANLIEIETPEEAKEFDIMTKQQDNRVQLESFTTTPTPVNELRQQRDMYKDRCSDMEAQLDIYEEANDANIKAIKAKEDSIHALKECLRLKELECVELAEDKEWPQNGDEVVWDGEGLPPVGVECEYYHGPRQLWVRFIPLLITDNKSSPNSIPAIYGEWYHPNDCMWEPDLIDLSDKPVFRPIETPEQKQEKLILERYPQARPASDGVKVGDVLISSHIDAEPIIATEDIIKRFVFHGFYWVIANVGAGYHFISDIKYP